MRWLVWIYAHWKLFRWHWKQQKQEAHEGYLSTQPYSEAALRKLREQR